MMFCPKCGTNLPDEARFCGVCGASIEKPEPAPVAEPAPVVEEPAPVFEPAPAPVFEPAPAQPTFQLNTEAEPPKAKKAKKSNKGLIAVIAVVTALAVLVGCFFAFKDPIMNLLKGNKGEENEGGNSSSADMGALKNGLVSAYGAFLSAGTSGGTTAEGNVKLNLRATMNKDFLYGFAASLLGTDVQTLKASEVGALLELLQNPNVTMSSAVDGDKTQVDLGVGLSGIEILKGSMFLDAECMMLYMGLEGLSEEYLVFDLQEMGMKPEDLQMSAAYTEAFEKLARDMPSEAEFAAMLDGYLDVVGKTFNSPEKTDETLDVGGVEKAVTANTYAISEQSVKDLTLGVLKQAENDETLHKILKAVVELVNTMNEGNYYYSAADADEIIEAIPELIAELEAEEADDEAVMEFVIYKDGDKACGYAVEVEDTEISILSVENGSDCGFELKVTADGQTVKLEGAGTKQGSKLTGEYALKMAGQTLINVELDSFDTEKGTGTIRITLGKAIAQMAQSELGEAASLIDLTEMAIELTLGEGSLDLALLYSGETIVGLGLDAEAKPSASVSLPTRLVDADEEAMQKWLEELPLKPVVEQLKKAGLPDEMAGMLEGLTVGDLLPQKSAEAAAAVEQSAA